MAHLRELQRPAEKALVQRPAHPADEAVHGPAGARGTNSEPAEEASDALSTSKNNQSIEQLAEEASKPEWLDRYRKSARPDHQACARDYDALQRKLEATEARLTSCDELLQKEWEEHQETKRKLEAFERELDEFAKEVLDNVTARQEAERKLEAAERSHKAMSETAANMCLEIARRDDLMAKAESSRAEAVKEALERAAKVIPDAFPYFRDAILALRDTATTNQDSELLDALDDEQVIIKRNGDCWHAIWWLSDPLNVESWHVAKTLREAMQGALKETPHG